MGNSESTSRMIAMQRGEDGIISVSERVMDHLQNRTSHVYLNEGEKVIHEEELKAILEKTLMQGRKQEMEKYKGELEKWQHELKETIQEKEKLRATLVGEEKKKVEDIEAHWNSVLEETKKSTQESLSAQLQAEQQQKVAELEAYYQKLMEETNKKTMEELKDSMTLQYEQQLKETVEKEREALRAELLGKEQEKIASLESLTISEEELRNAKNALYLELEEETNQKMKVLEENWKHTLEEETRKKQEEIRKEVEEEQETRLFEMKMNFLSAYDTQLEEEKQRIMIEYLEKEKQTVDAIEHKWVEQMAAETERKLKEAAEQWQLTLLEEESKVAEAVRMEVEGEQSKKVAEVEASCKEAFDQTLESEIEKLRVTNLENEQKLIAEIEARWIAKLAEKEEEHAVNMKKLQEVHTCANNLATTKILEQEEITSNLAKRVEALQFRRDDVQQQFDTTAKEVNNKITPLKQKAVCVDAREYALSCYRSNPSHPLRCSDEVQNFINCVQEERVNLVKNAAN